LIELEGVFLELEGRGILQDLTLVLRERRIAVLGANGSGKSSFVRLLNGLLLPSRGRVSIEGHDTAKEGRRIRSRVGFVFQNPDHQIVMPLVEEDLAYGLKGRRLPRAEVERLVTAQLERYGLAHLRGQPAHLLSGGEKQLLALAGVLVSEPSYVLFDEPTTLLDLRNALQVRKAIAALPQTAIVVTHDLDLIADFERVLVLDQGRVVADGRPAETTAFYKRLMAA